MNIIVMIIIKHTFRKQCSGAIRCDYALLEQSNRTLLELNGFYGK